MRSADRLQYRDRRTQLTVDKAQIGTSDGRAELKFTRLETSRRKAAFFALIVCSPFRPCDIGRSSIPPVAVGALLLTAPVLAFTSDAIFAQLKGQREALASSGCPIGSLCQELHKFKIRFR